MPPGDYGYHSADISLPEQRKLGDERMMGPRAAAEYALASTFCLCPTGDSKGFTARFYFSIVHRCLPVRFDGYHRGLQPGDTAYPFPRHIDWAGIVVTAPDNANGTLLDVLLAMPKDEVAARQARLRQVAPLLMYYAGSATRGTEGVVTNDDRTEVRTTTSLEANATARALERLPRGDAAHLVVEELEHRFYNSHSDARAELPW